ncbi:MAG TPA: MazG family protein [Acidimicrobiales bacterium]|nr:MazG family protein [Acidimicrobiales bacterium]
MVVGLGPAGPELVPAATTELVRRATRCLVRTARHPSVAAVSAVARAPVEFLDRLYEEAENFDDVYSAIVEAVVAAASSLPVAGPTATGPDPAYVVYAVPGSPLVAERTVPLLRADTRVSVEVVPALSFLDLAWARLGVDPVDAGVRIVDGTDFAAQAAGERGPLLVAQCHAPSVLSTIKLAADDPAGEDPGRRAVILHHLGLPDEVVLDVPWAELDRTIEPDHLTSVWVERLAPPVGAELVGLEELVRTLRARCPWDREQTHGSLARHLLEEAYEALDAIEAVAAAGPDVAPEAVAHMEEELGDLMFQVYFHAQLAAEEGHFTLADVARTLHDKLVHRHPHVFGTASATTPEEVAARWEVLKKAEKGRASVTDGIPLALPALALAAKLQRKAESLGVDTGTLDDRRRQVAAGLDALAKASGDASGETLDAPAEIAVILGEMLFALADAARRLGVDPETALRARAGEFRRALQADEQRLP